MLGEQTSRPLAARWAMMRDDGVAAAVVVAEDLGEEAPDGRDGVEHSVAVLDAMLVEDVQDAGFGQNLGKGKPGVAQNGADRLQVGH